MVKVNLPDILPIFPLSGALLLPRGHLPLHIFEPRYRNMTEAALKSDRLIGMVQPRMSDTETAGDQSELYPVGCAGRIDSFSETDDGRFIIMLRGICRFRIGEELALMQGFRRIRPDFDPFRGDLAEPTGLAIERDRLLDVLRAFLRARNLEVDWATLKEANDETLVNTLSLSCPLQPNEKQALLECANYGDRGALLISLLEIAARTAAEPTHRSLH